jgi:hypothetical protein
MDWIGGFKKSENKPTFRQAQTQTPATQHCFQANSQSFRIVFSICNNPNQRAFQEMTLMNQLV